MNAEQVFNHLQETRLINDLSLKNNLIFIGDKTSISCLRNKIDLRNKTCSHHYYFWENHKDQQELYSFLKNLDTSDEHTIIVVSVTNEHFIKDQVENYISAKSLNIKILKLFSDILVNILSNNKILLQPSETHIVEPSISYSIIATPRSGSTFLCKLLESTSLAGFPAERLRNHIAVLADQCQFDYVRCLKIIMTCNRTSNGVFGTKVISHFLHQYRKKDLDFDVFMAQNFSKYIYLIREDKVAQAVSLFIAQKTKTWHLFHEKKQQEYQQQTEEIDIKNIDLEDINKKYNSLIQQEKYLERFFEEIQVDPLVIKYEELEQNPDLSINIILEYLGINSERTELNIKANTKKTQSPLSSQIIEKFKEIYNVK